MKFVRKRDGQLQEWDQDRITIAITQAFKATGVSDGEIAQDLSDRVAHILLDKFGGNGVPTVEEIQDIVENTIMGAGYYEVARAYILYRDQRRQVREMGFLLKSGDLVEDYIGINDWLVNENANMGFSMQGMNIYLTQKVISKYWLMRVHSPEIRRAHMGGDFHIHDLGILGPYCVGWDMQQMLMEGFPRGTPGKIVSGPAKHFRVALKQAVNFLYALQGEAAGAQAFSNFDTYLAPFIAYDGLSYDEVYQAMQEFMFDMNVPTRVGFQTPFTNTTLDRTVPKFMEDEGVVIGGKMQEDVYGDFQDEMDVFNKAYVDVNIQGDYEGRIFSFPIPTYNITKDFDWEFPELWELTAKFGIPYFSNFINSDMDPEDVRSMCCRLRIDNRLVKRGGGFFGSNPLTGSIGVVTINLPRIGYLAKDDTDFFGRLEQLMDLAKESLILKRRILEVLTEKGFYPYSKYWLAPVKQRFGEFWRNHFNTIGLVGGNEMCLNFLDESIGSSEGLRFSEKVLDVMRNKLMEYQNETVDENGYSTNIWNLEASPAEGASYRLAKIDREKYPDIRAANDNIGDEPFYTNSTQLAVNSDLDLWAALKHQDRLQTLYTGGTVFHTNPSPEGVKKLVQRIARGFHLPYYTITPTFSICPNHGHMSGEWTVCPRCGAVCEVYSRIVGYFRPVSQWNLGKKSEFGMRKTFDEQEEVV